MNWTALRAEFGDALIDRLKLRLISGSSPQVDKGPFVSAGFSKVSIDGLFERLVSAGTLKIRTVRRCPQCPTELQDQIPDDGVCPGCELDFGETGERPTNETTYTVDGEPSREIPWLVALHGFNTLGDWQEEFGWLLSTRFRHRAPAIMYKFPFLFLGVLLKSRHESLAADLDRKLRTAIERAKSTGIEEPPDIVAHSFGSLLLARMLDRKESLDLRFGRVIVAGSIVPCAYDWNKHIQEGRIEAILNHCSDGDLVVEVAQWVIPDAGPSGRVGFDDEQALNYREKAFGHGTHFDPETMIASLKEGGLWDRFLRLPTSSLAEAIEDAGPKAYWRPWPALTFVARTLAKLLAFVVVAPVMVVIGGLKFVIRGTV